jgi:PAS domain-containing protein
MPQHPIEIILMRQLASYLAVPIFVVDPLGTLLYYNEPAEALLGRRYEETGELPLGAWTPLFQPTAEDGSALPPDALPLVIAVREQRAAHRAMWIRGLDGVARRLEVTAFPLVGQGGRRLGGVAIFWEAPGP